MAKQSASNCCAHDDGSNATAADSDDDEDEIPSTCLCPVIAPSSKFPEKMKDKTRRKISSWCRKLRRDCGSDSGFTWGEGGGNVTKA